MSGARNTCFCEVRRRSAGGHGSEEHEHTLNQLLAQMDGARAHSHMHAHTRARAHTRTRAHAHAHIHARVHTLGQVISYSFCFARQFSPSMLKSMCKRTPSECTCRTDASTLHAHARA
eukprot:6182580-Pleurochrysis_carterae.AAC.1